MQKICPITTIVYIERLDRQVEVTDLSVGYITKAKLNPEADTLENILGDATNLSDEEIANLKYHEALALQKEILRLTSQADTGNEKGDSSGKP